MVGFVNWAHSAVVARPLCMRKAPGSIPGVSKFLSPVHPGALRTRSVCGGDSVCVEGVACRGSRCGSSTRLVRSTLVLVYSFYTCHARPARIVGRCGLWFGPSTHIHERGTTESVGVPTARTAACAALRLHACLFCEFWRVLSRFGTFWHVLATVAALRALPTFPPSHVHVHTTDERRYASTRPRLGGW